MTFRYYCLHAIQPALLRPESSAVLIGLQSLTSHLTDPVVNIVNLLSLMWSVSNAVCCFLCVC